MLELIQRRRLAMANPAEPNEYLRWELPRAWEPGQFQELRELVCKKDPQLVFLCETKCKASVVDKIKYSLNMFGFAVDSWGRSGGLALLWHKDIPVSLRHYSDRFIGVGVDILGQSFRFTRVYGEPNALLSLGIAIDSSSHSWARLDRAAGNPSWTKLFLESGCTPPHFFSDHALLHIQVEIATLVYSVGKSGDPSDLKPYGFESRLRRSH
ncbi:hypothetical protein DH2020_040957 [Rehmannia glutinosa]|uniref:TLDc domain-containing protein n=1 Tax=Rehmannia glutinosa TaxID=99300 RepID=A0ABR0UTM7_REHGL